MAVDAAEIIQRLMNRDGMRLAELSKASGVNHSTISSILSRRNTEPRDTTLEPIAKVFNVSKAQLRGYAPIPGLIQDMVQDSPMEFPVLTSEDIEPWLAGDHIDLTGREYVRSQFPRTAKTFVFESPDDAVKSYVPKGGRVYIDPNPEIPSMALHPELIALIEVNGRYSLRFEVDDLGEYVYKAESDTYRQIKATECRVIGYAVGRPEVSYFNNNVRKPT